MYTKIGGGGGFKTPLIGIYPDFGSNSATWVQYHPFLRSIGIDRSHWGALNVGLVTKEDTTSWFKQNQAILYAVKKIHLICIDHILSYNYPMVINGKISMHLACKSP